MIPRLIKHLAKPKNMAAMAGLAAVAVAVKMSLEHLLPGGGEAAVTAAAAGTVVAGQAIKDFTEHLLNHICSTDSSVEGYEITAAEEAEEFEHNRKFNHDIELAVGRSLAMVLRDYAGDHTGTVHDFVTALAVRAEERAQPPRWIKAAESAKVVFRQEVIRDCCLNNGHLPAGQKFLEQADWISFLKALGDGLDKADACWHDFASLDTSLADHVEERFPPQFFNDIKAALANPHHIKAWAAMEYQIDGHIVSQVDRTLALSAENRDLLSKLRSEATTNMTLLWDRIDVLERNILAGLGHIKSTTDATQRMVEDTHALVQKIIQQQDREVAYRGEIEKLQGEITLRGDEVRSGRERIARLESALREAQRLAEGGNPEAEQALAFARQTGDIALVMAMLNRISSEEIQRERIHKLTAGRRIVERCLELADYDFRKSDVASGRDRLREAIEFAPPEASILSKLGRLAAAFRNLDIAAEAYRALLRCTDDSRWIAITEADLGDVAWAEGNLREARLRYGSYREFSQRIVKQFGETPEALRDVSVSLNKVGDVELAENGAKTALPLYQESLEIRRRIVRQFGETPQALRDVSVSLERVGDVERAENSAKAALPLYQESLEIRRRIARQFGETPGALRDVSISLNKVGDVELAENGAKAALPLYQESLEICRRIVRQFGETPQALRDVSVSLNKVGDVELAENGAKAALPLYQESLEIRRRIVRQFGETPEALRDVSVSLDRVGDVERAENGAKAALPLYQESLEIRQRIVRQFGETPEALRDVSVSLDRVGNVELAENGAKAALPLYQESLEIRRRIVRQYGETPQALRDVSVSLDRVGDVERAENGAKAALPLYQESLEIRRRIVRQFGETPESLRDVAVSLYRAGSG